MTVDSHANAKLENCMFNGNTAEMSGGAISIAVRSKLTIVECTSIQNRASLSGGAIAAESSSLVIIGNSLISHTLQNQIFTVGRGTHIFNNTASLGSGGAISLETKSSLFFKDLANISNNEAHNYGGAIHANDSTIVIGKSIHLERNHAQQGGGISLANSELYDNIIDEDNTLPEINFVSNEAEEYGGALYVDENSNRDACSNELTARCFFAKAGKEFRMNFDKNHAKNSGGNLFGGLLDRCLTNTSQSSGSSELESGAALFMQISNIDVIESNPDSNISSKPVNLCFCDANDRPDCNNNTSEIHLKRGEPFDLSVAAVDQIRNPVNQCHSYE